jgi:predicted RNA methylase
MRYFVQFPAGTSELVAESIGAHVDGPDIVYTDDSSMIFESDTQRSNVEQTPFVKNSFTVIADVYRGDVDEGTFELADTIRSGGLDGHADTFRVMFHVDGKLIAVDPRARRALESAIAAASGQRMVGRGLGEEYWIVSRTDFDRLMLCRRHMRPKRAEKRAGAISHELASLLVAASRPRSGDVFLDPFAGSGSFTDARSSFPAKRIVYADTDLKRLRNGFPQSTRGRRGIEFLAEDALALPSIKDHEVDVIVTDPPWGEYEALPQVLPEFLDEMARSFDRVLDLHDGRFVVLTSRRIGAEAEQALTNHRFAIGSVHEVLVNGHPASVLIGGREGRP